MLRLKASKSEMGEAWMLKAAGQSYEAIPVTIHVYGELDNLPANAEAALWMTKYNPYTKLFDFLTEFACYLAYQFDMPADAEDVREAALAAINRMPYNPGYALGWSKQQTINYLVGLIEHIPAQEIIGRGAELQDDAGDFVARDLNELFIRVRMNDEYNSGSYTGVCYFRIGSTYKNWTNQIWMFVHDHPAIKTVVVERDAESDGQESGASSRNVMINNMSRDEFLSTDRLPFLGAKHLGTGISSTCYYIIKSGKYSDLEQVRANASRVLTIYNQLRQEEVAQNYKQIEAPWATTPQNR